MRSSNDYRKQELYDVLFKSIKAYTGIDVDAEPDDPVLAFYQGRYPELSTKPMGFVVSFHHTTRDRFLRGYPEALRQHLWELCEAARDYNKGKKPDTVYT